MRYLAGFVVLAWVLIVTPVPAQEAVHAHHRSAPFDSQHAPAGQRWRADVPLREGMARIRKARGALVPFAQGALPSETVIAQAQEIRAAVAFMFANCALDAEPDAALHPVLAQLLDASRSLQEHPTDATPLADIEAAFARYEALFDERVLAPDGG